MINGQLTSVTHIPVIFVSNSNTIVANMIPTCFSGNNYLLITDISANSVQYVP